MVESLGPLTPGKVAGLEALATMVDAEENLRAISNASAAFAGGSDAARYVDSLHDARNTVRNLQRGEVRTVESRRAEVQAQISAFQVVLDGVEARRCQLA